MPSLSPATYYHYYPFGITDIKSRFGIICKVKGLFFTMAMLILLQLIVDYGLTAILLIDRDETLTVYRYCRSYTIFLPYTLMLYVFLSMIFHPLSLKAHCRRYVLITAIWTAAITFTLYTPIIAIYHCHSHNILGVLPLSIPIYALSLFVMFTLSASTLYILQIYPKSLTSMVIQCLFCCKLKYWKMLCVDHPLSGSYSQRPHHRMDVHLLSASSSTSSSEIMSDFDVDNEEELRTKFLSEEATYGEVDSVTSTRWSQCWCLRMYSRCCFWFYALESAHKLLLLLVVLDFSMLFSFLIFTVFIAHFEGDFDSDSDSDDDDDDDLRSESAASSYLMIMSLWLTTCILVKIWMKSIGKQLDITRLEVRWTPTMNGTGNISPRSIRIHQIREWTKRTGTMGTAMESRLDTDTFTVTPESKMAGSLMAKQQHYQSITPITVTATRTATDFNSIQEEVNAMRFELSFEISMEILVKATYYGFLRKYSLWIHRPTFSDFVWFEAVHCLVTLWVYHIRILPAYYRGSYWLRRYVDSVLQLDVEPDFNHKAFELNTDREMVTTSSTKRTMTAGSATVTAYDLGFTFPSMDRLVSDPERDRILHTPHSRTMSHLNVPPFSGPATPDDDSKNGGDGTDPDIQYVEAMDALRTVYGGGSAPNTLHSMDPHTPSLRLSASITYHRYEHWRDRICIDCVLNSLVMVVVTVEVYCAVLTVYLCGHYGVDIVATEQLLNAEQFRTSTAYFVIAMVSELWLCGMLYLVMRFCDPKERFNLFQPFVKLYAKSATPFQYALLVVACSWWVL